MDWVKSLKGYYNLLAIATGTDAMEVMFKRADVLAGELGADGFIPDSMLHHLTRKPAQARKLADQLVAAGLWVRVKSGYVIVDWATINAELVRLQKKKNRDRDRKRASRAASRDDVSEDASPDKSTDSHTDPLYDSERETQKKTAAAAAGAAAAAATGPLPTSVEILKSKLQAHTPLRGLRFDTLTDDQTTRLLALLEVHGDDPLVTVAVATCRNPAPTSAAAFLGTWEALPPPGRPLHVVRQRLCDTHQTVLSPSGTCNACASEQIARDR